MIKKQGSKYSVWSEDGKKRLGKPGSKAQATKRLREVEYFKHNPKKSATYNDHNNIKLDYKSFVKKALYSNFIKKTTYNQTNSTISNHVMENETVNTKETLKNLGINYKAFLGL
jgi:hypothetical protein